MIREPHLLRLPEIVYPAGLQARGSSAPLTAAFPHCTWTGGQESLCRLRFQQLIWYILSTPYYHMRSVIRRQLRNEEKIKEKGY